MPRPEQLSLRGAGTDYNILSRFFATKAQADAALADSSWVPTAGKTNGCLTGDQGLTGVASIVFSAGLTNAADDTAAASAGISVGQLYRTDSVVKIRVS